MYSRAVEAIHRMFRREEQLFHVFASGTGRLPIWVGCFVHSRLVHGYLGFVPYNGKYKPVKGSVSVRNTQTLANFVKYPDACKLRAFTTGIWLSRICSIQW